MTSRETILKEIEDLKIDIKKFSELNWLNLDRFERELLSGLKSSTEREIDRLYAKLDQLDIAPKICFELNANIKKFIRSRG